MDCEPHLPRGPRVSALLPEQSSLPAIILGGKRKISSAQCQPAGFLGGPDNCVARATQLRALVPAPCALTCVGRGEEDPGQVLRLQTPIHSSLRLACCGLAVESSRILQHLWRQYDIKLAVKPVLLRLWPGESHWQFGPPFPRSPELTAVPRPGLVQQLLSNSAARPTYLGLGGEAHHKPCRPGHIPDQIGTCGWDPGTRIYESNNHQRSRRAAESEDQRPDGVPAGPTVITHQCQSWPLFPEA